MTYAADLHALEYEAESAASAFGEAVSTFATQNLPVIAAIDISKLSQEMIDPAFVQQRLQAGASHIAGPQGGSITTRTHLPGNGTATTGAVTQSALANFLAYAWGKHTAGASGTTFAGGGTANAPTTTASGTLTPGQMLRGGAGGLSADGRGNGAWSVVDTHVGTTLTTLVGFDARPNNLDVLYSADMLYLPESGSDAACTVQGIRMRFLSDGLQYELHGCFATAIRIGGLNAGETPWVEIDWQVAWWQLTTGGTFPTSVTSTKHNPAPIGNGGLFVAAVGTATRDATSKRNCSSFQVEITLGMAAMKGHNGVSPYQTVRGARRTPSKIKIRWVEEADSAATLTPFLDAIWGSSTRRHVLWEGSRAPLSAIAMYFRSCCPTGPRPVPFAEDGVWRVAIELMAYTGTDTTSALTLAAMVLGLS